MSYLNLDLSDTKAGLDFEPVPAGVYEAQIIDSELSLSKNDNEMLNLTWLIIDGEQAERMVFDRIMLSGTDKSVKYNKVRVRTLAEAVGHPNPNFIGDPCELHGLPCLITVAVKKGTEGYSDSNEIKNYQALNSAKPQPAATASPANAAPARSAAPPPNSRSQTPPAQRTAPPPRAQKAQTPFDPPPAEADAPF